jgi:glycosyltransferase involved in cell wall biosynthesis
MKVAILGTRGIPNHYGGFEQLAEYISVALAERGHDVFVYNSSLHPYKEKTYKQVNIIHCYDPEDKLGTFGQFIYDLNCIRDSRKRNVDVIFQLGYTSSSIWASLLPKQTTIITNMDGLEWKRSKYSNTVKHFLKYAEKWAVQSSDELIADSLGIQSYLKNKYNKESVFIPYGASPFYNADEKTILAYGLQKANYYLAVARFEPENNIETIIKGYLKSGVQEPLVLIGSTQNKFGKYLTSTYKSNRIMYLGSLYDISQLNSIRYFCKGYFHGHSVGGTNPSLLEAMASQAFIYAHKNAFNEAVLRDDALYFSNEDEIASHLLKPISDEIKTNVIAHNLKKIETQYTWKNITDAYENLMLTHLKK